MIRRLWAGGYRDRIVESFGTKACSALLQVLEEDAADGRENDVKLVFEFLCQLGARHKAIEKLRQLMLVEKGAESRNNVRRVIGFLHPSVGKQIEGNNTGRDLGLESARVDSICPANTESVSQPRGAVSPVPRKHLPVQAQGHGKPGRERLTEYEARRQSYAQIFAAHLERERQWRIGVEAERRSAEKQAEADREKAEMLAEAERVKIERERQLRNAAYELAGEYTERYRIYVGWCKSDKIEPVDAASVLSQKSVE